MRSLLAILILALMPLHLVWAGMGDCRDQYVAPTSTLLVTAASSSPAIAELSSPVLADIVAVATVPSVRATILDDWDWEFLGDDAPDIVEKLSALDLRDIDLDKMSCSVSTHQKPIKAGALDPHEFDLPNLGLAHVFAGNQQHVLSYQPALIAAPVFRTFRPPMTAL